MKNAASTSFLFLKSLRLGSEDLFELKVIATADVVLQEAKDEAPVTTLLLDWFPDEGQNLNLISNANPQPKQNLGVSAIL